MKGRRRQRGGKKTEKLAEVEADDFVQKLLRLDKRRRKGGKAPAEEGRGVKGSRKR